jgi:hypothetical protein
MQSNQANIFGLLQAIISSSLLKNNQKIGLMLTYKKSQNWLPDLIAL